MGNIKDIVDLAKDLESRAKDRKDIETLRSIISLTQSIQTDHLEIVERDLKTMTENSELKQENAKLKRQLEEAQSEDIRIHRGIEFRRGNRTLGRWIGFCPKCHLPAQDAWRRDDQQMIVCTAGCGWQVFISCELKDIVSEIESAEKSTTIR